ncbi:MAG: DUF2116 family Zn-ribbon domain-containing protein [Bacteroidales bacterium]|nr:DUF2116 family Zn-ribbon domain-containing protein [Bacteroidales bacterium]
MWVVCDAFLRNRNLFSSQKCNTMLKKFYKKHCYLQENMYFSALVIVAVYTLLTAAII